MAALGLRVRECVFARNKVQCFIKIFLRFGVAGWKVVINGKNVFDVLSLFCKAASRDSKRSPAKIVSTRS